MLPVGDEAGWSPLELSSLLSCLLSPRVACSELATWVHLTAYARGTRQLQLCVKGGGVAATRSGGIFRLHVNRALGKGDTSQKTASDSHHVWAEVCSSEAVICRNGERATGGE